MLELHNKHCSQSLHVIMPDDIEKGMLNVCIILSLPPSQPLYEVLGMRMNNEDGH